MWASVCRDTDTSDRGWGSVLTRARRRPTARPTSVPLELARRQGASLFELRAALDDFGLRGEPARDALIDAASRVPTDSGCPELARSRSALDQMAR
jgi:hypothetical protein